MTQSTLPPDLALLARIVDAQPPDVQELFQYALTMLLYRSRMLIEDGKAHRLLYEPHGQSGARSTAASGSPCSRWQASCRRDIVKPDVGDETLAQLREMAGQCWTRRGRRGRSNRVEEDAKRRLDGPTQF